MKDSKKDMGNVQNKVPKLRFPEFEGEWEEKKLGEIANIARGKSKHRPRDAAFLFGGNFPFIQTGDVKAAGLYLESHTQTYSDAGLMQSKLWDENTLCITIAANIAETTILKIKACFPDSIIGLVPKEDKSTVIFIKYQFDKFKVDVQKLSEGIAQANLNLEKLMNIKFSFPSLMEQKKISLFLSLIDERIQTQSKIIEGLKLLKISLSKKIFSCELRFKDIYGNEFPNWEQKSLGEFLSVPEKNKANDVDKEKILTVKLHLKGVLKNDNTETLSLGSTAYFVRKKGQFIYGKQNLFNGAMGIIPEKFDGYLTSGDVPALNINDVIVNPNYLLYYIGREDFYKKLEDIATGSGSKRIHESTFLEVKIFLPNMVEQIKITDFLSSIDSKIEIESTLLQKLEAQKKYLLANLFI